MEKCMMLFAVFADLFIGDPRSKFHPIMMMGALFTLLERYLYKETDSQMAKRRKGMVLVCAGMMLMYSVSVVLAIAFFAMGPIGYFVGSILVLAFMIRPRSLAQTGLEVKSYLESGELIAARRTLNRLVLRDTDGLDDSEVVRAVVEAVAKNLVNGVLTPLIYFFLGGFPMAVLCRAVDTMARLYPCSDERYADFGFAAEKLNDVFNYIPARAAGLLLVVTALLLRYRGRDAFAVLRCDAKNDPSPNDGYPQAAAAGALGIRLGGRNTYGGVEVIRPYIGEAEERPEPKHIEQMIRLLYGVTILFALIGCGIEFGLQ